MKILWVVVIGISVVIKVIRVCDFMIERFYVVRLRMRKERRVLDVKLSNKNWSEGNKIDEGLW